MTDWMDRSWADDAARDDRRVAEDPPSPYEDVSVDGELPLPFCPVCGDSVEDCDDPHNRDRPAGVSVVDWVMNK